MTEPAERDPATAEWRTALGQSTSARLRQVEAELHDALRRASDLEQVREELRQQRYTSEGLLADLQDAEGERDAARAEAAEMRAQLLKAVEQNEVLREGISALMRDLRSTGRES